MTRAKMLDRSFLRAVRATLAGALVLACGGLATGPTVIGGESHFLRYCAETCGDGLECIGHVCTRGCRVGASDCSDLSPHAQCTGKSVEPGVLAVCDAPCIGGTDCSGLGSGYRCEEGFCRTGQNPNATAGSCRVAHRYYPSGSGDIPPPQGCGACTCEAGELSCTEVNCELGAPIFPCPENVVSDPIGVEGSYLVGRSLTMQVSHSGGCERHDFALCYSEEVLDTVPPQRALRLIHDGHGDDCAAVWELSLRFDLGNLGPGVYALNYGGLYGSGALACSNRTQVASNQVQGVVAHAPVDCVTEADCEAVTQATSCHVGCDAVLSRAGADQVRAALTTIDAEVCGDFAGDGCAAPEPPSCDTPTVACIAGTCQASP